MGWRSLIIGFAVMTVFAIGSWGQSAPAIPDQPRYAVMLPPINDSGKAPPLPAPTTPVSVSQAPPVSSTPAPVRQPLYSAGNPPQSRYSAEDAPKRLETITVTGLRPSEGASYRLGTGDKVHVTVFNEPDLSGDFTIDGQGYVRLPLVGQIEAAGLSTYGLENRIASAMVGGGYLLNPKVSVEVTTYRPFYIIGDVAKPGEYPYVNGMSAPNAIALAGGYTPQAVESVIWIRHQGRAFYLG